MKGLIFTYVWNFSSAHDGDYLKRISKIFTDEGGEVCLVELEADLEERLERNKSDF